MKNLSAGTTPWRRRRAEAAAWLLKRFLGGRVVVLSDHGQDSAMASAGYDDIVSVVESVQKHSHTITDATAAGILHATAVRRSRAS